LGLALLQPIIPFNPRPREPEPLPRQIGEIDDAQFKLCQEIFDQQEERRTHLEQKAQWTFAIIIFLVPLLTSIYVLLFRDTSAHTTNRFFATCFLFISGVLLLLGFISIVRAILVQARETLFLSALIDQTGQFLNYSKARHAKGLLWCGAMNTASNDHIAQFVKGAQILVAGAVIALLVAAVPAGFEFSSHASSPTQVNIGASVSVTSTQLDALTDQVGELKDVIAKSGEDQIARNQLLLLQNRVTELEAKQTGIRKVAPSHRSSKPINRR
jgi:hypothetical protein